MANDSKNIGNVVERYSKALLELAIENKSLETVHDDVEQVISLLESSKDFSRVIKSPIISRNDNSLSYKCYLKKGFCK